MCYSCDHLMKTESFIISYAQINFYPRSLHKTPQSSLLAGGTGLGFGGEGRGMEEALEVRSGTSPGCIRMVGNRPHLGLRKKLSAAESALSALWLGFLSLSLLWPNIQVFCVQVRGFFLFHNPAASEQEPSSPPTRRNDTASCWEFQAA